MSGALSQPPPPPPDDFGGPRRGKNFKRIRDRIKTVKIWKLTEELNLTQKQSEQFFPVYNIHQSEKEQIEINRRELFDKLEELTEQENPDEKSVYEFLDQLDYLEQQMISKRIEFRKKLENILSSKQIGRFVIFEVNFQKHIREIIEDTRNDMQDMRKQKRRNK
jgi:Spy/CpxP family protein refolding chaperone